MRVLLAVALLTTGCAVFQQQSNASRAQEAANELNVNGRFGRMEMAVEHVAPAARDAFLEHRKAWGGAVRVADYEMAGFKMKGSDDAEMFVKVAWYRMNEGDLHITMVKQKFHDFKGDWKLVEETRSDGEVGLLGEPAPAQPANGGNAPAAKKNAQFPTIRLGQPGAGSAVED